MRMTDLASVTSVSFLIYFLVKSPVIISHAIKGNAATSKITTTSISRMLVKFPRGHFTLHVEDLPAHLQTCFPSKTSEPEACLLRISVDDEADVKVHGFAMPFANPGHISEDWLLRFKPIVGQHTLLDILQSKSFVFIVPKFRKIVEKHWDGSLLPPEFSYPFGERHDWDADRMSRLIQLNKGLQYPPSWTFEDDNAHMTVLTQCMAQDVLWIDECRQQIRRAQCSAYFIPKDLAGQVTRYYAILALDKGLKSNNLAAWRRLAKDLHVDLELFKTFNKDSTATAATLQARILEHPKAIDIFRSQHPVKEHEIVLSVTVHHKEALDFKLATFESRAEANTALEQGTEH